MVSPEGGKLINTPKYGLSDNVLSQEIQVKLNAQNEIEAVVKETFKGLLLEDRLGQVSATEKENDKFLTDKILHKFHQLKIEFKSFELNEEKLRIKSKIEFKSSEYSETAGNYLFIPMAFLAFNYPKFKKDKKRVFPIQILRSKQMESMVVYELDKPYSLSSPIETEEKSKFGYYQCIVRQRSSTEISVYRKLEIYEGLFEPSEYKAIKRFFDKVKKSERSKFTLKVI